MSKPIISVRNLGKKYTLGATLAPNTLRDHIAQSVLSLFGFKGKGQKTGSFGNEKTEFWALRDVSFDVQEGEVLGVIGHNGAGKSTLLKILSQITEPTTGEVRLNGRVVSLLEVGTGFHKELSGRENIYLNGAILGMSKAEIRTKFDEIVNFSGVEKFIDTPVKRYSSGMTVRLAFAVAAHLDPEILLIDEVLAVGDAEFQKKCLGKMDDVANSGRTILFVSHNMAAVQSLCNRSILLNAGNIEGDSDTESILSQYQARISETQHGRIDLISYPRRGKDIEYMMTEAYLCDSHQNETNVFRIRENIEVNIKFCHYKSFRPVLGVVIKNSLGIPFVTVDNRFIPNYEFKPVSSGIIKCQIYSLPLMPGIYKLDLYLGDEHRSLDRVFEAISFNILPVDYYGSGKLPNPQSSILLWDASFSLTSE